MRAYATCGNLEQATGISDEIRQALARFQPEEFSEPKRYWKMPELFEFTFNLSPATEASFLDIVKSCDEGWLHMGNGQDRSSVWNQVPSLSFLTSSVTWAELALMP
jgi:hypothetical protein